MDNMNQGPFYFFPFMSEHKIIEEEKEDPVYKEVFFTPELTLLHGNAFKKEYIPYKNYKGYIPSSRTEEEELLLKIQMYGLLVHDINLHLDIYPRDKDVYQIYKKYNDEYQKLCLEYQEKYAPLLVKKAKYDNRFTWVSEKDYKGGL